MRVHDHELERYLGEILGAAVAPTPWTESSRLPPFVSDRYRFLQATLLGHAILFMVDEAPAEETPAKVRKHIAQVQPKCECPVIYVRAGVTAYNRKRLIEQRVPFVVPGNQMYLPDLGIDLREHFRNKAPSPAHLRPATQAVLIHALLRENDDPLVGGELASQLGYTAMTLSRAFDEIESAGLAESSMSGRERRLRLIDPRRELWRRAQSVLKSPVKLRHFVQPAPSAELGPKAGLSALARYSMIADPSNPVVAVAREQWTALKNAGTTLVLPVAEPDAVEVEVWSYAPRPYRDAGVVDPLSLYLALKAIPDERVQSALDHMLEGLPW